MSARLILAFLAVLLTVSCATKERKKVEGWPGSEVYMLPQEGGFQDETLELKDGRFRYWFSSDVILPNAPKYPIEGNYHFSSESLTLSVGKTYAVRPINGVRTLWRPEAVDYWDQHQVIDVYGILLPVQNITARKPTIRPLFTEEQWRRSADQVRQLEKE